MSTGLINSVSAVLPRTRKQRVLAAAESAIDQFASLVAVADPVNGIASKHGRHFKNWSKRETKFDNNDMVCFLKIMI